MKVEVAVLGYPSLIALNGLCGQKATLSPNSEQGHRAQELCESRGGHPGLPVPNNPYGLCGRKATLKSNFFFSVSELRSCVEAKVAVLGVSSLIL